MNALRPPLYAELAGVPVGDVAKRLGLRPVRGSWGPCPGCGADRRGSEDPRGPVGVSRDGRGWRCHACGVAGDAAALVLAVATGGGAPGAAGWARARELAVEVGLVAPVGAPGASVRVARVAAAPPPPLALEAPLRAAPPDEVAAVWSAGCRVTLDAEVSAWLRDRRGLDPDAVARLDLARAYPPPDELAHLVSEREGMLLADGLDVSRGASLAGAVAWAAVGSRSWSEGWRLLLPTWSARGVLVGVRARWVQPDVPRVKEANATGLDAGPAVYADPVGRWLLERGPGARAGDVAAAGWKWSGAVVISEGGPDFLTAATARARLAPGRERTAAILGVWNGSWGPAFAARLPPGCTVHLAVHDDDAGRAYASKIQATLPTSCRVGVMKWSAT